MIIPTVMGSIYTGYEFTSLQPADINWYEIETEKNISQTIVKRIDNSPVTISPIVYGLGSGVDKMKWGIRSDGMVYKTMYWLTAPFLFQTIMVTATYDGDTIYNTVTVKTLPEPLIIKPSAKIQTIYENSGKDQLLYTAVAEWQGYLDAPMPNYLSRTHGSVKSSDATFSLGPDSDPAISIDKDSGEVKLTIDPDFETKALYFYSVKATLPGSAAHGVLESIPYPLSLSILNVEEPVLGCTDADAANYDENADVDDGSCIPCDYGCMDTNASNYNAEFTCPDSSCIPCVYGCMDTNAYNVDPDATCPDSSCKVCDQLKINYNSNDDCPGTCGSKSALCEGYKTDYDSNCGCSS